MDSIRLSKLLRKEWVVHWNKPDTSSTDDNQYLSLVVIQLTGILELGMRQTISVRPESPEQGEVTSELQDKPLCLPLKVCWSSSGTGCALQVPVKSRVIDSQGSTSQGMGTRQCAVAAEKKTSIPVDCHILCIISSFLSAWKNEKWFVNMLKIWGWGKNLSLLVATWQDLRCRH